MIRAVNSCIRHADCQSRGKEILRVSVHANIEQQMKIREKWIDRWRGILILSIVLRHVSGPGVDRLCSGNAVDVLNAVMTFSIAFSLPAFFVLAGYLRGNVIMCFIRFPACKRISRIRPDRIPRRFLSSFRKSRRGAFCGLL